MFKKQLDILASVTCLVKGLKLCGKQAILILCFASVMIFVSGVPRVWALPGDLLHTFLNPSPGYRGDGFGYTIAGVGNNVLVGDYGYDDARHLQNSGAAYLFDGITGELLLTIT